MDFFVTPFNEAKDKDKIMMGLWNMCLCSKICRKVRISSLQSRSGRKTDRFLRIHPSRVPISRLITMPESSIDATVAKLIPLCFLYGDLPSFLQIVTIPDSHQSLRLCSFTQIGPGSFVNSSINNSPSYLRMNGDSVSYPAPVREA